ncbi:MULTISPECIES: hypothetical protein [Enterobacter]|uniref:hypothetical protein n=1 Tax=Enterobacter TaxID=547 RepID=UPI001680D546|nr:hypothetical protein [Enterobacter hormaechei]MDV0352857.1 hypothetical protein [Enterobacter hormaechei]MDV0385593.1 hypothetical protein [Enterobacter hormaechei]MDV2548263.1 hypothetical protein [Enterobacter hormaechei]MEA3782794.1 hypothetical protein [Enterobacter hormaechei]
MSIKNLVEMIKHNGLLASMAKLEKLYQVAIENEQKLAELESNLAALAAENALLKKSEPAPFSKLMMEALDLYQAGADEVPELAMLSAYKKLRDGLKTPATDAFLAEVRAQGVEMLNTQFKKCTGMLYADSVVSTAEHFAAQLRKGVQS